MHTAHPQAAVQRATQAAPAPAAPARLAALALAAVMTLSLLAGIEGLASADKHAPVLAQAGSTQG
jgi:hypothetical protein